MTDNIDINICGYPHYRNKTITWCPMDTEWLYRKNSVTREKRKLLKKFKWKPGSFDYTFNEFGFRSGAFDKKEQVMFLGCSYTAGIGVPQENCCAELVAKDLRLECQNLGVGGASLDTVFRLGRYWIPKLQPKFVVLIEPTPDRIELKQDGKWKFMNARSTNDLFYKKWLLEQDNIDILQEKNILAIENLCTKNNTKLIRIHNRFKQIDKGRDLAHPGIEAHKIKAQDILKLFD